jgi:alginate O-acetyltransferase complex protein AlgI
MLFNEIEFWIFFLATISIFYALPFRFAKVFLIMASCVFYSWWNPKFVILLFIPTLIDFYTADQIGKTNSTSRKKMFLMLSLVSNLGILFFFKYYNFFISNVNQFFGLAPDSFALHLILPVGISFYTFNAISYVVDVYRGTIQPTKSLTDFALFIVFFPHLVAGPIVRAADFLPQITAWKKPSKDFLRSGIDLVLVGLVKKMIFADQFAVVSDQYFSNISASLGWVSAWTGVLAFSMQIFFDFSGYTDIARGCARLLGFEFNLNFARPYLSGDITEFWRRWHVSLSSWLRDYLYIPLGGNRGGQFQTYRNLMLTMLLGGLWHGASWNFVIWGSMHGIGLALHRLFSDLVLKKYKIEFPYLISAPMTFVFVIVAWIFFRAANLSDSLLVLKNLVAGSDTSQVNFNRGHISLLLISGVLAMIEEKTHFLRDFYKTKGFIRILFYVVMLLVLMSFSNLTLKIPFVYFQF